MQQIRIQNEYLDAILKLRRDVFIKTLRYFEV